MIDFIINGVLTNPYFLINIFWMATVIKVAMILTKENKQ